MPLSSPIITLRRAVLSGRVLFKGLAPCRGIRVVGVLDQPMAQLLRRAVVVVEGLLQGGRYGAGCGLGHGAVSCCGPSVVGIIIINAGGQRP